MTAHYGKNSGSEIVDQRQRTTKFLKVSDQCEAEALFLNSGPAEADYGKNSCLSIPLHPEASVFAKFPKILTPVQELMALFLKQVEMFLKLLVPTAGESVPGAGGSRTCGVMPPQLVGCRWKNS